MPTRTDIKTRTNHTCWTPGCQRPARSNIAYLCENCRDRMRRNGDARQTNVRRAEMRPMEDRVREIISRGHLPMIRQGLQTINDTLVRHSEGTLASWRRGQPMNRHVVAAHSEVLKVAQNVDPVDSGVTVAALYLLAEHMPRRIVSDEGMAGQLVRVYRLQRGLAIGVTWDGDKRTSWYRPLPKDTTQLMGATLRQAYSPWLAHVLAADKKEHEEEQKAARELAAGFGGM